MFLHAEFDYGPQQLGTFIGNLTFPMVGACNIDASGEPALRDKLKQYVVLQYRQYKVRACMYRTHMHSCCHSCSTTPQPRVATTGGCCRPLLTCHCHALCCWCVHGCWRLPARQIGVVGWITPTTGETSRDVGGVKFTPIIPSVKACLQLLKKDHPKLDYIVGLSHSGACLCAFHPLVVSSWSGSSRRDSRKQSGTRRGQACGSACHGWLISRS